MTNGEKIQEIFPDTKIITQYDNPFGDRFMVFTLNKEHMQVNIDWWNAEYKEPTTKNDLGVDAVSRQEVLYLIADNDLSMGQVVRGIHALPSVTPQEPRKGYLSIDDVMSVFDDFMCGEVDEDGITTFLEMLIDKAGMREVEE